MMATLPRVSRRDDGGSEPANHRFARILRQHGTSLTRIAAAWTRSRAERDDLAQDIAVAIWRALPDFRGDSSERTFVIRIASNRAFTHAARRRLTESLSNEPPSTIPDPESAYADAESHSRLLAAIRRLPDANRQVMTLALEGLSSPEIGEVLGINSNCAAVRLTRAKQALREALTEEVNHE